jgi:hypothetical protein
MLRIASGSIPELTLLEAVIRDIASVNDSDLRLTVHTVWRSDKQS